MDIKQALKYLEQKKESRAKDWEAHDDQEVELRKKVNESL